ncbi:MAG: hypothetical protein K2X81_17880 [Candidatus Obscuribacterales bacterium]|nr:hypothetical protein [Candidatus Obscuribacterales bacterium]
MNETKLVKKRVFNPRVETRLTRADMKRLDEAAKKANKTRSDYVRQVLLWSLDNEDKIQSEEQEAPIEKRLKKMEDRLAALMARTAIDVGSVYALLWHRSAGEDRKELFDACYKQSIDRLKKKLGGVDAEVKDIIKNEISR